MYIRKIAFLLKYHLICIIKQQHGYVTINLAETDYFLHDVYCITTYYQALFLNNFCMLLFLIAKPDILQGTMLRNFSGNSAANTKAV